MDAILRLGPSAAGIAEEIIAGELCERPGGDALFLVRSEVRRRELRAAWLDALGRSGRAGAFEVPLASLEDALARLYRALPPDAPGAGLRLISPVERRVLLERAMRDVPGATHFLGCADRPGFVERLARFVKELGDARIYGPDEFLARLPGRPGPRDRELAAALEAYARGLGERGATDAERAMRAVTEGIERIARPPRLVVIEGFYQLPRALREFLRALARRAKRTVIAVEAEADDATLAGAPLSLTGGPLEAIAGAVGFYMDRKAGLGAKLEVRPAPAATKGRRAARRIFRRGAPIGAEAEDAADVSLFEAPTPAAEVERIARLVRERIAGRAAGAPPERIAVVFPTIETYAAIVREVFPRYGVPFALLHGHPLAASPVVRALFDLIEAAESRLERASVARALLSPYVGCGELRYGPIDRIAREAGIAGPIGRAGFAARLAARRAVLARRLAELGASAGDPERGEGDARARFERRAIARDLETIAREGPALDAALAALEGLAEARPADGHERALLGILARFEVERRLLGGADAEVVARDAAAVRALVSVLRDVTRGLGGRASGPLPLSRYAAALRVALAGETYRAGAAPAPGSVLVLGRLDIRGLRIDRLFFGGLGADDFPGARTIDIFYGERERRALGLATSADHTAEMRYIFAGALAAADAEVVLSFPAEGTEPGANASPFIVDVEQALGRPLAAPPEAGRGEPVAAHEVLARAGALLGRADGDEALAARLLARAGRRGGAALRGVRAAISREDPRGPGRFEGILAGPAAEALRARGGAACGPTELERYVACPFRSFAERHLGLAPLPEVEDDLDAREAGDIVHRILRRFYEGFDPPLPPSPDLSPAGGRNSEAWLARAAERMLAIAREELAAVDAADAFRRAWRERLVAGLEDGGRGRRGALRLFLEQEAAEACGRRVERLEARVEIEIAGTKVHGALDRVDADLAPGPDGRRGFVVLDYKTGRFVPTREKVCEGRALQLPFYALAAAHALGAGFRPVGAAYYPIALDPRRRPPRPWRLEGAALEAALARAPQAIGAAIAAVRAGIFHPGWLPPGEKGCGYCDYARVCRVDHARMEALAERGAPGIFRPLPLVEERP